MDEDSHDSDSESNSTSSCVSTDSITRNANLQLSLKAVVNAVMQTSLQNKKQKVGASHLLLRHTCFYRL